MTDSRYKMRSKVFYYGKNVKRNVTYGFFVAVEIWAFVFYSAH